MQPNALAELLLPIFVGIETFNMGVVKLIQNGLGANRIWDVNKIQAVQRFPVFFINTLRY